MKVTAIILKYRKSFQQLYLNGVLLDVDKFVIVDNSENNRGTAAGYTEGMKQVKDGFIWLLDEDNIPGPDALKMLKYNWEQWGALYTYGDKKRNLCLASNRKDYDKISDIESVISGRNSCYGLNIFDKFKPEPIQYFEDSYNRKIPCSMYGGMFFHSDLLKVIGYPNEKYFIYSDDHEWSYKIPNIILVKDSIINEPPHRTDNEYYRVRNAIWFSKQFVTNRFKFYINCLIYKTYLRFTGRKERFRAVKDGMKCG